MRNLEESVNEVHDRESFIEFVRALIADREHEVKKEMEKPASPHGPSANGWENNAIEGYLEASFACMQAWMGRDRRYRKIRRGVHSRNFATLENRTNKIKVRSNHRKLWELPCWSMQA